MKKSICALIAITLFTSFAVCQKTEKDLVLIKQWSDLAVYDEVGDPSPMMYDMNNRLFCVNAESLELRVYDEKLGKFDIVQSQFPLRGGSLFWSGFGNVFYYKRGAIITLSIGNKAIINKIDVGSIVAGHCLFGNFLLVEDDSGKLKGYLLNTSSAGIERSMSDTDAREYIRKNSSSLNGLYLDKDGIPLFRGVPLSRRGFLKYWGINAGYFNAIDSDLNTCFSNEIRDKGGRIIETFALAQGSLSLLTLDFEGNAYVSRGDKMYYVGRDWGYHQEPRNGICSSDNLRLRIKASTNGYVVGKLMKGQSVVIIKTGDIMTFDGESAAWYKVKTSEGLVGWAWGGYIKVLDK